MSAKERPILMAGRMAQGSHEGWKKQTRRVMKVQPPEGNWRYDGCGGVDPDTVDDFEPHWLERLDDHGEPIEDYLDIGKCPYGVPGDRLWVRETFRMLPAYTEDGEPTEQYQYRADGVKILPCDPWKWSPSIHMDRAACRTVLELTDVRVERLQDISEEDAKAEGVIQTPFGSWVVGGNGWTNTTFSGGPIDVFSEYWDSLAKPGEKWGDNPFVWRIEFRRVEDAELV